MGSGEGRRPRTPLIVRIQSSLLHIVVYCGALCGAYCATYCGTYSGHNPLCYILWSVVEHCVVHIQDTIPAGTYCSLLRYTIWSIVL